MSLKTPLSYIVQPLRAVIFDMDGVTLNTMPHIFNWQKLIYNKFGDKTKDFPSEPSAEFMDFYNEMYLKQGLKGIYDNVAHADWDNNEKAIWAEYEDYNAKNPMGTISVEGVDMADVIKEVYSRGKPTSARSTRLRLGINTTKSGRSLKPLLKKAGLDNCFDSVITYDNILKYLADGKVKQEKDISIDNIEAIRGLVSAEANQMMEKPNSLSAMMTLYNLGVEYNEVIVFEDTVNGIQAYKPVMMPNKLRNVYVVGVTWGFENNADKLFEAGADAVINKTSEIVPLIESLGGFM